MSARLRARVGDLADAHVRAIEHCAAAARDAPRPRLDDRHDSARVIAAVEAVTGGACRSRATARRRRSGAAGDVVAARRAGAGWRAQRPTSTRSSRCPALAIADRGRRDPPTALALLGCIALRAMSLAQPAV
jgi:hypothetical protein